MPELWAAFHPPEAEDPHGEDYFDLIGLSSGDWDALFDDLGLPNATDMIGGNPDEHAYVNARLPADKQTPWRAEMANWQDPEDGLAWTEALLAARAEWPVEGHVGDYVAEQLETFARVLQRAKAANLKFHLFVGT